MRSRSETTSSSAFSLYKSSLLKVVEQAAFHLGDLIFYNLLLLAKRSCTI